MNTKAFLNSSVMLALVAGLWLIPAPPSFAAFPGVNGKIAFVRTVEGQNEIFVMNADGSQQTNLTNNTVGDGVPAWSPDGTQIAFPTNRDGNDEIYVMNADGSSPTNLTNNPAADGDPAWCPDGTIVFSSNRDGNFEIYQMDTTGVTRLTDNLAADSGPACSPDGTWIAFQSNRDGNLEIYAMNRDGTGQTNLTQNPNQDDSPNWSPDGTKIAFGSGRLHPGESHIFVMNPDGSGQTQVNTLGFAFDPAWSPDGTKITYYGKPLRIHVINVNGTGDQTIGVVGTNDSNPDWQPVPISVEIDIKPGSFPNSINPKSNGVVPVAILTTDTFDATTVDPLSVEFGPAGATESHGRGHIEDVDGDGDLDLVLHFRTQDAGIQCGDTSASLTGNTFEGAEIQGSDSIRTVGCK